jgi:hypothetical protein
MVRIFKFSNASFIYPIILLVFFVILSSNVFAESCSVTSSCNPDNILMRLSAPSNALIGLWNETSMPYYVCCDFTGTHNCTHEDVLWLSQIHGITNTILWLNDTKNTFAEYPPEISGTYWNKHIRACFSNLSCVPVVNPDLNLPMYNTIFPIKTFSMTSNTNARIGNYSAYPIKIHCGFTKCGDGIINQYGEGWEQCDDGANNGKVCTPNLGGTCPYCTSDCQTAICDDVSGKCYNNQCDGPMMQNCTVPELPYCGYFSHTSPLTCPNECQCFEDMVCNAGQCVDHSYDCRITKLYWDPVNYTLNSFGQKTVKEGDEVRLKLNGTNCDLAKIYFDICEFDVVGPNCEYIDTAVFIYNSSSSKNYATWRARWRAETTPSSNPEPEYWIRVWSWYWEHDMYSAPFPGSYVFDSSGNLINILVGGHWGASGTWVQGDPYPMESDKTFLSVTKSPVPINFTTPIITGHGVQTRTCTAGNWSAWSPCTAVSCEFGYTLCSGICDVSSRYCEISGGVGAQSRNCIGDVWSSWSTCVAGACDPGYSLCGNSCNVSYRYCPAANGTGIQSMTCNAGVWSSWGTCNAISCNPGYYLCGSTCNLASRFCSVPNGIGFQKGSCTSNVWVWDVCKVSLCNPGYFEIPSTNTCGVWSACP